MAKIENWSRKNKSDNSTVWLHDEGRGKGKVKVYKHPGRGWVIDLLGGWGQPTDYGSYNSRTKAERNAVKWMRSNPKGKGYDENY